MLLKPTDKYLNHFDVIKIVMTDFIKSGGNVKAALAKMQKLIIRDLKKQYPNVDYFDTEDLRQSMADVYEETKRFHDTADNKTYNPEAALSYFPDEQ